MKGLLFGGAFNPLTNAHLFLAEQALKETGSDYVLFIPSKSDYILSTEGKGYSFSDQERLQMLLEVSRSHSWMKVSDYELSLKEQPRTYFTLKHFEEKGERLSLLIGSDWLIDMKKRWKYVDEIASQFGIVVMERNDDEARSIVMNDKSIANLLSYFTFVKSPSLYRTISSSKVRELLLKEKEHQNEIKRMVPKEVFDYLKERCAK